MWTVVSQERRGDERISGISGGAIERRRPERRTKSDRALVETRLSDNRVIG